MTELKGRGRRNGRGCCGGGCVLGILTLVAMLMVIAAWGLQRWPGEDWWLTTLLTWGPQVQWVLPPTLVLLVTVARRRRFLSLLNAATTVFALLAVAHFQVNPVHPDPGDRPVMRAATWNVHGYTRDRETLRDRILSWNCDVVCLQESNRAVLEDLLPGYEQAIEDTLAVYVRGEILRHERVFLGEKSPRKALLVEAVTDAGPVTIINVHLPRVARSPFPREVEPFSELMARAVEEREARILTLLDTLPSEDPAILAGDFNTPPGSRYWRLLDRHLIDAFEATGFGFGHTFLLRWRYPLLRIDYVWVGGGAEPVYSETRSEYPSDHRPVIADIALPPREEREG